MGEGSSKSSTDGMVVPKKRTGLVSRDNIIIKSRYSNSQICSQLGSSSTTKPPKIAQVGSSEKGKCLRPLMQSSSSGKEVIGSSRRTTTNPTKPLRECQKTLTSSSEDSNVHTESKVSLPPVKVSSGLQAKKESTYSTDVIQMEVGKSSGVSNLRSRMNFNQKPGLHQRENENIVPAAQAVSSKYGLRNIRCNTISDVIPSSCSTSDSTNRRKTMITKRNSEGESSSTVKGKKVTGSLLKGLSSGSRNGISISDARGSRNIPPRRDNGRVSVRTERPVSGNAKGKLSRQGHENPRETNESPVVLPNSPHSIYLNPPGISCHASRETPSSRPSSYSRSGTGNEELCSIMPMSPEDSDSDTSHSLNEDDLWPYNMDNISEVLSELERFEEDGEELTYGQIANLLLDGRNFYDHHRDMRLDIDNMSYEELLALEERMGTVSTALTAEALSDCLKRSVYQSAPSDDAGDYVNEEDNTDTKCCICQDEYVVGDEFGTLQCTHRFHVVCIKNWLQLKNWCPICKEGAAPSNSSSSH